MDEYWIKYKSYNRSNTPSAREMRKNPTPAEEKMWQDILKHRPWGYKFTRQKPIWSFILDFYCAKLSLAIELDGEVHKKNKEYDKKRTSFLFSKWISVIRYWNNEVIKNTDKVYKDLLDYIRETEK
jgi:very-short-patch-repair endonuclease